jgi:hypothetical protein
MFGKNKKEEAQSEPENVKTETIEAKDEKTAEEQLTATDKQLLGMIEAYKKKYDGVYNAQDFLTVNQAFTEAEKLNLNFAEYAEIVGLREDVKELTKAVKAISLNK